MDPRDVLEGTQWEFANGARVVFVYSDITEATVHLRTPVAGGMVPTGAGRGGHSLPERSKRWCAVASVT